MTDDTRDVIARAIAGDSIDYSEYQHARVFRQVNTILAALDAKGLVIVPLEPTEAMEAAAENAELIGAGPLSYAVLWRAMIAAGGDDG